MKIYIDRERGRTHKITTTLGFYSQAVYLPENLIETLHSFQDACTQVDAFLGKLMDNVPLSLLEIPEILHYENKRAQGEKVSKQAGSKDSKVLSKSKN